MPILKKGLAVTTGLMLSLGVLTACSSSGEASTDSINLRVSTIFGPDNWQTQAFEKYAEQVTNDSDGAITFEYFYGDSLVSTSEMTNALGNSTIDIAYSLFSYEPAKFPISTWISEAAFLGDPSPDAGVLQKAGTAIDWSFNDEEYLNELDAAGLQPLIPRMVSHSSYGIMCSDEVDSLDDLKNKRVRVGGAAWSDEARNLGMVPVDLPASETFTSFQQGLIDCFIGGATDVDSLGLTQMGGHYIAAGLTGYDASGLIMSKQTWDSLDAELQDALWDALPTFVEEWNENYRNANLDFVESTSADGVIMTAPDPEMQAAIDNYHASLMTKLLDEAPAGVADPGATLSELKAISEKWGTRVEELGFSNEDETWAEMSKRENGSPAAVTAFADEVKTEILDRHRPAND